MGTEENKNGFHFDFFFDDEWGTLSFLRYLKTLSPEEGQKAIEARNKYFKELHEMCKPKLEVLKTGKVIITGTCGELENHFNKLWENGIK